MNFLTVTLFFTLMLAALASASASMIAWQKRPAPGAVSLALLLLAVSAWSILAAFKTLTPDFSQYILFAKLEIAGQTSASTLFLIFVLEYTRQDTFLTRRRMIPLLWIIPLLSFILALSNETHYTFWLTAQPGPNPDRFILHPAAFYWFTLAYYYLTRALGSFLLVLAILRFPQNHRLQANYLLAGTIAIWSANITNLPQMQMPQPAWEASLHPIAYAISGLIFGWAIFRHQLIDIVPIDRDTILDNTLDGILVLDKQQRVVDINLAARYLLQLNPKTKLIGIPLQELLKNQPEILQKLISSDMPFQDIYIPSPADLTLEAMTTPIMDRIGQVRGTMITLHDISNRVRAEAIMRQSEENLRQVFENAPFPIIVTGFEDGNIMYINPAGLKLYNAEGKNIQNVRSMNFYQHPETRENVLKMLESQGAIDNIELALKTSEKQPIWVATSIRKVTYSGKNALLITQMDVSDRRRNLEELRQSRAQLRDIFEHVDAGIYLLDPIGSLTFSNERWAEMLGQPVPELTGTSVSNYIFKSDTPYSRHLFESLIAGEIDRYSLELRYQRQDGSIFWGALSAIPVFDKDGEIESIVNFVTDVTQRKETENALRETERRFSEILEKIYLFAVVLDNEGNITFCNEYFLNKTGWHSRELIGGNWFEIFAPKNAEAALEEYQRAIRLETLVSRHENEILTIRGNRLLVAWSNILLRNANGKVIGSASIGEDITERKRAQQSEQEQRIFAEALYDTAAALTSTLNFEEVLDRILENIDSAVETDAANISLIKGSKLYFVRAKGYEKHGLKNEDILNLELSVSGMKNLRDMYNSKEPICIPDTLAYPAWKPTHTSKWMRSYIGVPIIIKERVVGFINIDSATPNFFSQAQAERLRAFSLQAAIAIENTRLYTKSLHELEERKRAQARLRRANQKLKTQLAEIEALQTKLREQAIRDSLTGLYNRRYLEETLPEEIKQCSRANLPLSLMMIDIDHFKTVNDTYGHQVGDTMLKHLGILFQQELEQNGIAYRYGGEEFAIVLPKIDIPRAYECAEKIRQGFAEYELKIGKKIVQATVSIGIAGLNIDGHDGHSLLTAADNALYKAKDAGRNCIKTAS